MTTLVIPEKSLAQRMEALRIANDVRTHRAGVKRDLKSGRLRLIDLIREPDERLETMKVFDLMLAAPKLGRVKVNRILNVCRVSPSKRLGGLSPRQRSEIVGFLR